MRRLQCLFATLPEESVHKFVERNYFSAVRGSFFIFGIFGRKIIRRVENFVEVVKINLSRKNRQCLPNGSATPTLTNIKLPNM